MTIRKKIAGGLLILGLCIGTSAANAAPVVNGGWYEDTLTADNVSSDGSPYAFTLLTEAWFRITDAFLTGDTFTVFETGGLSPLLTTSNQAFGAGFGDNTNADFGWTSASYGSAEILLSAGDYSLEVFGDCGGGCPANFFARIDTASVPLPAGLPLLAGGLAAIGFIRRSKTKS